MDIQGGSGIQDEHAPRNADGGSGTDYAPTDDEKKAIKLVERVFEKNKRHRSQYDQSWLDYYHMFRGKQWKESRPSYRHAEVINFVFRTLQTLIPIQLDSRPRFEFLPEEPSDFELAEIVNEAAEADWQRNNWQEQLLEVVLDANLYGCGLSEVCTKKDGIGTLGPKKIVYESADPFYAFPDPDARDVNKDCGSFIYAKPTEVSKIKKQYPDKAEYLKPDLQDLIKGSKTDFSPFKFRSPVDQKVMLEGSQTMDLLDKEKALLLTCWLSPEFCEDEYDEKEAREVGEDGVEKVEYTQVAKYPKGRKIVTCNGVLLEDGPNPYDDGKIPFQRYVNYILSREFWGISEVEQLAGPQRMFNKIFSFALDVLTLMGNPIWVVDTEAGVDVENLTNRPGLVVEKNKDGDARREEGTQLQPYVMQLAEQISTWIDSLSGSQDVTRGVQPTGVTAATAITALQESANTRVRQKSRNLDGYLQQVGSAWNSRLFQYRTAPEIFRLTNKQGAEKYFRMHVEDHEFTRTETQPDPATGQPTEVQVPTGERGKRVTYQPYLPNGQIDPEQQKVYETRAKFDCRVSTGSQLPFNKAEKEAKLLGLFDRKIIDEEEVLKSSDYPNWEAVLQRMQMKAQQMAEAEAQANAPQQPPPAA